MNMISTGAFLTEMDASNKQPTIAEKFAAVWEKKNAKAARAGGVSLMALSLAACGSSSDDEAAAPAPVDPTPVDPTPADPAPVALTTTDGDVLAGTAQNDSYTGVVSAVATAQSYDANDTIIDASTTDNDTLTVTADDDVTTAPTITNVENVSFTLEALVSADDGVDFDVALTNIKKGTEISFDVDKEGSAVSSLTVTGDAGGVRNVSDDFLTVNTNNAAAVTYNLDAVGSAATNVDFNATGTGSVTIDAAGFVDVDAGAVAALVQVTAANDANISDSGDALSVIVNAGGDITVTDADTAAALRLTAGGDITVTTADDVVAPVLTAGGDVSAAMDAATSAVVQAAGTVTLSGAANTLATVNITDVGSEAMAVDLTGAGTSLANITVAGRNNIEIELDASTTLDTLASLNTTGMTGGATVALNFSADVGNAATPLNLLEVAPDSIELSADFGGAAADTVTVASGSVVNISVDQTTNTVTIDGKDSTAAANTVTVNLDDGVKSAAAAAVDVTSVLAFTDFGAVTVNADADARASGAAETVTIASLTSADGAVTINMGANDLNATGAFTMAARSLTVTGSGDVDFGGAITASAFDASAVTGDVTVDDFASDEVVSVTTGSGDDTISATAAAGGAADEADLTISAGAGDDTITLAGGVGTEHSLTISGGEGTDTLVLGASATHGATDTGEALTITGIEKLSYGDDTTIASEGVTGQSFELIASTNDTDTITVSLRAADTSVDLSGFTVSTANAAEVADDTFVVNGSALDGITAITGSDVTLNTLTAGDTVGATLTGGVLADELNGGAKADTIVAGGGADTINGGGGADTINLTEATAASDTLQMTNTIASGVPTDGADTVTGFAAGASGDIIDFDNGAGTFAAAGADASDTASTGEITIADYVETVGGGAITGGMNVLLGTNATAITAAAAATAMDTAGLVGYSDSENAYIAVSNGSDVGIFHYAAADSDDAIGASELDLVLTLTGVDIADISDANFANFTA